MWLQVFRGYKHAQLDSVPENDQLVRPLSQLYVTPQPLPYKYAYTTHPSLG